MNKKKLSVMFTHLVYELINGLSRADKVALLPDQRTGNVAIWLYPSSSKGTPKMIKIIDGKDGKEIKIEICRIPTETQDDEERLKTYFLTENDVKVLLELLNELMR